MIVWGGWNGTADVQTGGRYTPATNTWSATAMSTTGAPTAREGHSAVWTGREMIVWSGTDGTTTVSTGARYNPVTNAWLGATTTTSAPVARWDATAVWTGTQMIVFGGYTDLVSLNHGQPYQPGVSLSTGSYTGNITLSDPNASNNTQTIAVTYTVSP